MAFNIFFYTLMTIFIFVSLFLILLVLIQKGRGGGLASAFGGGGGNTAFGSKTGDVLTWATSIVFGVFLFLAIILNLMANTHASRVTAQSTTLEETVPVTPGPTRTSTPTTAPAMPDLSLPPPMDAPLPRVPTTQP